MLNSQKTVFTNALDSIGPGLAVLADQRQQLTQTLTALSKLGAVGTHVINASKADTIADLKALQPTLAQLTKAGTDLPNGLELLSTFPFPEERGRRDLHQQRSCVREHRHQPRPQSDRRARQPAHA
ncbi:Mce/MlaD family protein [Fodinicola feengrottensis]|uniref:hypothetical protein n=1 Tax=Fodinicola feengrottensis TaxID=435914 RepID=UPI0013D3E374|nr:hypothetical protein [Fodinicola feengrottensis]